VRKARIPPALSCFSVETHMVLPRSGLRPNIPTSDFPEAGNNSQVEALPRG
jgi:hypothetical protein